MPTPVANATVPAVFVVFGYRQDLARVQEVVQGSDLPAGRATSIGPASSSGASAWRTGRSAPASESSSRFSADGRRFPVSTAVINRGVNWISWLLARTRSTRRLPASGARLRPRGRFGRMA